MLTITDDYYGLTARDLELARQISAVARELGVPADPSGVQHLIVSIDALAIPKCCRSGVPSSATTLAPTPPTTS